MQFASRLLFVAIICKTALAYSTGAGSCDPGSGAPQGLHLSRATVITGLLEKGGFTVSLDGKPLVAGVVSTFPIQTDTSLTISGIKSFRGFLMRLGETGVQTDIALANVDTNSQISTMCTAVQGVGGVTHTSSSVKTTVTANLSLGAAASGMPLDVTVVVQNSGTISEYYSTRFLLTAAAAATPSVSPAIPPNPGFPPCPVCGTGKVVTIPSGIVSPPGRNQTTCQIFEQGGLLGFVDPAFCPFVPSLATNCGCMNSTVAPGIVVQPTTAPVTMAPVTKTPVTMAPVTKAPVTMAPVTKAPVTMAPVSKSPVTTAPATLAPVTKSPVTTAPATVAPVTKSPVTTAPATVAPVTKSPVTTAPATVAPVTKSPVTTAPATVAPVTKSPVTTAPATVAPATKSPVTTAPATVAPATKSPVTTAPATVAPVTKAPVVTNAPVVLTKAPVLNTLRPTLLTEVPAVLVTPAPKTGAPVPAPVQIIPTTSFAPIVPLQTGGGGGNVNMGGGMSGMRGGMAKMGKMGGRMLSGVDLPSRIALGFGI